MKLDVNAFVTERSVRRENKLGRETETDEKKRAPARSRSKRVRSPTVREAMPRLMPSLTVGLLTQQLLPGTQIDRVPDKRKRTPGLAAVLWPKSKEHHTPFTHRHFGQGNLVFDFVFAPQPAGPEHIVFSITSDDMDFVVRCFQC